MTIPMSTPDSIVFLSDRGKYAIAVLHEKLGDCKSYAGRASSDDHRLIDHARSSKLPAAGYSISRCCVGPIVVQVTEHQGAHPVQAL